MLNFATDAFNENNTSYWHKNIGGYHAAKLRRYQELIERHISPEMQAAYQAIAAAGGEMDSVDASKFRVLNMLNTKYFIFPAGQQGQTVPVLNPYANGNAWFVKNVQYVNNANEEIDALKTILPTETAVVDTRFKDVLKGTAEAYKDSLSSIRLTSYEPNRLVYETDNAGDGIAVFSEIYTREGWRAYIDGEEVRPLRADYILRALELPAGSHTVEWRYRAPHWNAVEAVTLIFSIAVLAAFIITVIIVIRNERRQTTEA